MTCQICRGEGAVDEIVEYWPLYSIDERPALRYDTRIVCPRCEGEERYPITENENVDNDTRRADAAADLA